jgi:hypothetical protein
MGKDTIINMQIVGKAHAKRLHTSPSRPESQKWIYHEKRTRIPTD